MLVQIVIMKITIKSNATAKNNAIADVKTAKNAIVTAVKNAATRKFSKFLEKNAIVIANKYI